MNPILILQGVTLDNLLAQIESIVEKKLNEKIAQLTPSKKWHYMSRNEVAKLLKISLPTLHDWTKQGIVISYRIGSRILFRSDEIDQSVTQRKFKKYF